MSQQSKLKGGAMRLMSIFLVGFMILITLACSTPEERVHKAKESVHKERLNLVEEYKKCLEEAGDDKEKTEACDRYLKAAEALR